MEKLQFQIPLPKNGINCIDDSLIHDTEAAEGTVNMSFKNGIPQTRKGFIKYTPSVLPSRAETLFFSKADGTRRLYAQTWNKLYKLVNNEFVSQTGQLDFGVIDALDYPSALGFVNTPENLKAVDGGAGTLAAGTYVYRVSAYNTPGETIPCAEVSITLSAGSKAVTLSWDKMPCAHGYRIYGRAQGTTLKLVGSTTGNTYTDTGSISPSGDIPTANTTALPFADNLLFVDGNKYYYYRGSAFAPVPPYAPSSKEVAAYGENVMCSVPDEINKQKFILNDDERIWLAGYGRIVRVSHLNRPDYFPSTQVWKLEEDCTGMTRFMGEVLLFTENTATLISGKTPDWTLPERYVYTKLPGNYGCSQHRSIATGNNAVYWANKNGVYRYRYLPSGYSIPECVSEFEVQYDSGKMTRSIKAILQKITDWTLVFADFFDQEYRLHLGGGKVLVFDTISSTWAYYEYANPFFCGVVSDDILLYGGSGNVYRMDCTYNPALPSRDGLSDDGQPIQFVLKSKFFDFSRSANKKRFKKMFWTLYSELISYDIDLILNIDNDQQVVHGVIHNIISRWGEFKFGDRITTKHTNLNYPVRVHHKGKKYNIQYELRCNGLNMAFTLIDAEILLKVKELK